MYVLGVWVVFLETGSAYVVLPVLEIYRPGRLSAHRDPPASASSVLGLKVNATTARHELAIFNCQLATTKNNTSESLN